MKLPRSRRALSITLAAVIVLAIGGVASASIPSGDGRIQSCVAKNGAVRVIDTDAGARCTSSEKRLAWNQRGPAGVAGAAGPAGPPGATGPMGPQGPASPDEEQFPTSSGICAQPVPKGLLAGKRFSVTCKHRKPFGYNMVVVSPAYTDAYAQDTYVLEPQLDYSYRIDLDTGTDYEFTVLVRLLRDMPVGDFDTRILFTYMGKTTP